jgi:Right handed beta helix region
MLIRMLTVALLLLPLSTEAATYYVGKNGSDAHSCPTAQAQTTPRLTVEGGRACLGSGDTLLVGTGTYVEVVPSLPSGLSDSQRTVLKNAPGATPVLQPTAAQVAGNNVTILLLWDARYITVEGFVVDMRDAGATGVSGSFGGQLSYGISTGRSQYITVQHTEVRNAPTAANGRDVEAVGIVVNQDASDCLFRHNYVHHLAAGSSRYQQGYGFYFKGTRNIAEYNRLEFLGGYGFHIYNQAIVNIDLIVRHNTFRDIEKPAILLAASMNARIHNNVIAGCSSYEFYAGIAVGFGGAGAQIYNNTIVRCHGYAIQVRSGEHTDAVIRNNIAWGNSDNSIQDGGMPAQIDHNLQGIDPRFVNDAARDFRLRDDSPCIDTGTPMPGLAFLGSAPDRGALEFGGEGGAPSPPISEVPPALPPEEAPAPPARPTPRQLRVWSGRGGR